ncbi:hypothetical protein KDA00_06050, partial [Candidatus Saccharibacteria bacterium]|nr:hypothetical protein [Candidatus Saccharibacteria bacterium]
MNNPETLTERLHTIADAGNVLYRATFMPGAKYPDVDCLTVFESETTSPVLTEQAQELGEVLAHK